MRPAEVIYDWCVEIGAAILPRAPFLPHKARRGIEGRRDLLPRIDRWSREERGEGPLVWFHAPSVGEGLQTRPVIEAVRELRPELEVFYSFFSPSAEPLARDLPVDFADYLPFDIVADLMQALKAVRPSAVVFGKLDVWPNLTRVASWSDVPLILVNGTLAPSSSRARWPARRFLAPAYGRLDAVGAISADDRARLIELGVEADRVEVTGDARFDQVWARARAIDPGKSPVSLLRGHEGQTLVAGSTWPECERHLVPVLAQLRRQHPEMRSIIVPHEPTSDHLQRLEAHLEMDGLTHTRLSALGDKVGEAREVVVVDSVGSLGELYALADIAYVGGGFGRRGLHSVLEPAALGVPVLFGPRHKNAREAGELIDCGGALPVGGTDGLNTALRRWLEDAETRKGAAAAALDYVRENLGAGRRNAELICRFLP
jgi:3-deoxy-D-manno-octulosonic-acid transferase